MKDWIFHTHLYLVRNLIIRSRQNICMLFPNIYLYAGYSLQWFFAANSIWVICEDLNLQGMAESSKESDSKDKVESTKDLNLNEVGEKAKKVHYIAISPRISDKQFAREDVSSLNLVIYSYYCIVSAINLHEWTSYYLYLNVPPNVMPLFSY